MAGAALLKKLIHRKKLKIFPIFSFLGEEFALSECTLKGSLIEICGSSRKWIQRILLVSFGKL